jgi:hypothetical protein
VVAHEAVEPLQFGVGEAGIGLADGTSSARPSFQQPKV